MKKKTKLIHFIAIAIVLIIYFLIINYLISNNIIDYKTTIPIRAMLFKNPQILELVIYGVILLPIVTFFIVDSVLEEQNRVK